MSKIIFFSRKGAENAKKFGSSVRFVEHMIFFEELQELGINRNSKKLQEFGISRNMPVLVYS